MALAVLGLAFEVSEFVMSKLTLNVEKSAIEAAKAYARRHRTSLSKLVTSFLKSLSRERGDPVIAKLHQELLANGFKPSRCSDRQLRRRH